MKKIIGMSTVLLFLAAGCEDRKILSPEEQVSHIRIEVNGLEDPGPNAWYEAWLLWNRQAGSGEDIDEVSIGIMSQTSPGTFQTASDINLGYLQAGLRVIVTIQLDDTAGNSPPSDYRILGADIAANRGEFTVGNEEVLDYDFSESSGQFILATPTEDPANQNPTSGIWFVKFDTTITVIRDSLGNVVNIDTTVEVLPGLDTVPLPDGWIYETWLEIGNENVSAGTFDTPVAADDSATFSGPQSGYNYPGEDFLNNAPAGLSFPTDLRGARVYVTATPAYPVQSNVPYTLIPFEAIIPSDANVMTMYPIENSTESFPGGNLSITIELY